MSPFSTSKLFILIDLRNYSLLVRRFQISCGKCVLCRDCGFLFYWSDTKVTCDRISMCLRLTGCVWGSLVGVDGLWSWDDVGGTTDLVQSGSERESFSVAPSDVGTIPCRISSVSRWFSDRERTCNKRKREFISISSWADMLNETWKRIRDLGGAV